MPTAAKLIAAVAFAVVGWLAAGYYVLRLPEGTSTGYFREITAALGFVIGWLTLGSAVGRGYGEAVSLGLRTSLLLLAWALIGFSVDRMIIRSTKMTYKDVGEAVLDVPMLMLYYGKLMGSAPFIATLIIGGVLGGLAAEAAARRWR